jgi:hypothetical protein
VTVTAAASRDCVWSASSASPWLQVSPATGQGDGTLTIVADANSTGEVRIGAVIINDVHLAVTQGAPPPPAQPTAEPAPGQPPAPAPVPAPAPTPGSGSSCSFNVTPRSASFSSSGGSGTIAVTAPSTCAWTAKASDKWIDITSDDRDTGSGVVRYKVDSHKGKDSRSGSITVAGTTVTITQAGKN